MSKSKTLILFILVFATIGLFAQNKSVYRTNNGKVTFTSIAPLETIKASSNELKGIIDTSDNGFAFSVYSASFKGFNSQLQQEHFYENYLESGYFPVSTFTGKIIESIDFNTPANLTVRAKGILMIHGVKVERIIKCQLDISQNKIVVNSDFQLLLSDFNIKIPRIVNQKIAPEINVTLKATMQLQNL